jgi:hypothetical protein
MGTHPLVGVRHPESEVLRRFALGLLDHKTTARVERHLLNCDACCRIAVAIPDDRLLTLLRRVPGLSKSRIATTPANRPRPQS